MVRRARTFGKPKKHTASRKSRLKKDIQNKEGDGPPSEEKWATMTSYRSFVGEYLTIQLLESPPDLIDNLLFSQLNCDVTCNKSTILKEKNTHLPRKIGMFRFNLLSLLVSLMFVL